MLIYIRYAIFIKTTSGKNYYLLVRAMDIAGSRIIKYILDFQTPPATIYKPREIKPETEEVEVIVAGYGILKKGDMSVLCGPGSAVWYYSGEKVEAESDPVKPYRTFVFSFQARDRPQTLMPFYFEWENIASCINFCREAFNSYQMEDMAADLLSNCVYARMLWEATRFSRKKQDSERPQSLQKAISHIDKRFAEKINIDDIAVAAGVSTSYLHCLFKKHFDTSPVQYLLKLRLSKAAELLLNTSDSVKQICFAVGFADMKNFCSYFKRHYRLTPTQYRNLHPQNIFSQKSG